MIAMIGKTKDKIFFYSVRYTDVYGKRKQKYHQDPSWTTKREAKAAQDVFLASTSKDTTNITFDELYGIYFRDMCSRNKQVTTMNVESVYTNHIKPFFGSQIVKNITPRQIVQWQEHILSEGYRNGTLKTFQVIIKSILRYGIEHELIEKSPFKSKTTINKSQSHSEMSYWLPSDFNTFIDAVDDPKFKMLFMILYWAGLRKGEALALTVGDVDLRDNVIIVNKTYDAAHKLNTTPKTSSSYRRIQMTQELNTMLTDYIKGITDIKGTDKTANLFYLDYHISPATIETLKNSICSSTGVKKIRIHDIRHSHVSLLINMGFTPFEIAKRLGHSAQMVENVYGHLFVSSQKNMVERLDEVARKIKEPVKPVNLS